MQTSLQNLVIKFNSSTVAYHHIPQYAPQLRERLLGELAQCNHPRTLQSGHFLSCTSHFFFLVTCIEQLVDSIIHHEVIKIELQRNGSTKENFTSKINY